MIAPTDQQGFEQLRNASIKLAERWQREAVAKVTPAESRAGPLTCPATEKLHSGTELEPGEAWLVPPELDEDGRWLTPAVKWRTRPGSRSHQTEFFGPILSVMKAKDLDDAIGIVNSTGFGLTSGLQSLDTQEQTHWTERIEAETSTSIAPPPEPSCNASPSAASRNPQSAPEPRRAGRIMCFSCSRWRKPPRRLMGRWTRTAPG